MNMYALTLYEFVYSEVTEQMVLWVRDLTPRRVTVGGDPDRRVVAIGRRGQPEFLLVWVLFHQLQTLISIPALLRLWSVALVPTSQATVHCTMHIGTI